MKVWQWIRDAKSGYARKHQIEAWFLMNRLYPCDLIVKSRDDPAGKARNAMRLKDELPPSILNLVRGKYYGMIDAEALRSFLGEEINEKEN